MALPTVMNNAGYRAEAKPVILVSTDANGNPVASAGNSSGITAVASFVPTASAYGAGDIMDTAKRLKRQKLGPIEREFFEQGDGVSSSFAPVSSVIEGLLAPLLGPLSEPAVLVV